MSPGWVCACLALAAACLPRPPGAARLRGMSHLAANRMRPGRAPLSVTALVGTAALLGGLALGPAGAVASGLVTALVLRRRAARAAAGLASTTAAEVADALHRIADELRTGAHPATALDGVHADGPLARVVLAEAATAAHVGEDISAALRRAATHHPSTAVSLDRIADSWALAERHGIPLADLLDAARTDIDWRLQFGRRVQAQLAGPRATTTVLTALPAVGLLLGQLLGADPIAVLRNSALGQLLVLVGSVLIVTGSFWCDRILRSAVPR